MQSLSPTINNIFYNNCNHSNERTSDNSDISKLYIVNLVSHNQFVKHATYELKYQISVTSVYDYLNAIVFKKFKIYNFNLTVTYL
jgi:hypothetical protein